MADPLAAMQQIGRAIAASQMFGCETESQGQVLALHCLATGRDPLSIVESYHLMHGKLTLKSEEMLARLVDDGGTYEIVQHSPEAAEIAITYRGRKFRERFTWEEARLEPFVYQGKPKDLMPKLLAGQYDQLQLSTNYATPRRRMQHLWARVVSDAVRVIAPNLLRGKYTPEETYQAAIEDGKIPPTKPMPLVEPTQESEAFDAAFEVVETPTAPPLAYVPKSEDDPELGRTLKRITELFSELGVPGDQQLAAIKKRGARDMGGLDLAGAMDLVKALEQKKNRAAVSPPIADPVEVRPASEQQVAEAKSLLAQVVQLEGYGNVAGQVRDHLAQYEMRLVDLTETEIRTFIRALSERNLELFFGLSLQGFKVARQKEEQANP